MTIPEPTTESTEAADPGMVRAGAAAAARRRELDISQRSLAADGVINAGALIAFEKGRSWPRERTRAKLEEILRWPPGTIARIRRGEPADAAPPVPPPPPADDLPLVAQVVLTTAGAFDSTIDGLPDPQDPDFAPKVMKVLAELRELEGLARRATRISRVTPPMIKALSAVRTRYDEVMMRAAAAPHPTLGQRLYAARRRANLTIAETAEAADISDDDIIAVEAEEPVSAAVAEAVEALIGELA